LQENLSKQGHFLDAWKTVIRVTFHSKLALRALDAPGSPCADTSTDILILNLLEAILVKLQNCPTLDYSSIEPLSVAIGDLALTLRELPVKSTPSGLKCHNILSLLIANVTQRSPTLEGLSRTPLLLNTNAASLAPVYRGHLYAAILNFMQYSERFLTQQLDGAETRGSAQEKLNHLLDGNLRILEEQGDDLIVSVAQDSMNGQSNWKSLALVTLDSLLGHERSGRWLNMLCSDGYLQRLLHDISTIGHDILSTNSQMTRQRYVYTASMSLLLRIASSKQSALQLSKFGVLQILREVNVFKTRPNVTRDDLHSMLPSQLTSYHEVIMPCLRLLVALLTSLPQNETIIQETLLWLYEHESVVAGILQDVTVKDRMPSLAYLEEAGAITAILSHVAVRSNRRGSDFSLYDQKPAFVNKFDTLVINLLSHYSDLRGINMYQTNVSDANMTWWSSVRVSNDAKMTSLHPPGPPPGIESNTRWTNNDDAKYKLGVRILRNAASFLRNRMDTLHQVTFVLFSSPDPRVANPLSSDLRGLAKSISSIAAFVNKIPFPALDPSSKSLFFSLEALLVVFFKHVVFFYFNKKESSKRSGDERKHMHMILNDVSVAVKDLAVKEPFIRTIVRTMSKAIED
jgi:hypothetical protein